MKKFKTILLFLAFIFAINVNQAQSLQELLSAKPSCGTENSTPIKTKTDKPLGTSTPPCAHLTQYWYDQDLYIPTPNHREIKINLNFFFMQQDDGTACFRINNKEEMEFINEVVDIANNRLSNFSNHSALCNTSSKSNNTYVKSLKIKLVPKFFEIKNTSLAFIPAETCPGSGWVYENLTNTIHNDPSTKNGINIFFAGEKAPWDDYVTHTAPHNVWTGAYQWCSEYPSFTNMNAPLSVVIENLYVKYKKFKDGLLINGQTVPWSTSKVWLFNGSGPVLAHEILHNLDLTDQIFLCSRDIMNNSNGSPEDYMYASDMGTCHQSLSLSNVRQFVDCDQSYGVDRLVTTDETWDADMRLYNDVVVKTGGSLTVTCKLLMAENATITVERGAKLIIDGGTITSANTCKYEEWKGIYVWGNSKKQQPDPLGKLASDDAGVVILKNNAIIEHSRTAISTSAPSIKWPQYADYYGGVIYAEGSNFINNTRAVEFMSYKYPNKSKFVNCTFKEDGVWRDNTTGVTIWDCHQISFEGNTFETLDMSGIMGIDFDANVLLGNTFKKLYYGIESYSTSPSVSKLKVDGNVFEDNFIDIASLATAKDEGLKISSNTFKSSPIGIIMQGPTAYDIRSNTFKNTSVGTMSYETGEYDNKIACNDYQVQYGIGFMGNNNHSQFLQNDFNSVFDVVINATKNGNGAINKFQGDNNSSASNCFTTTGNYITADKNTEWFFYFAPDKSNGPCYIPINNLTDGGSNNYDYNTNGEASKDCEGVRPPNLTNEDIKIIREHDPLFTNPPTYIEDHTHQTEIGKQIDANNLDIANELLNAYPENTKDATQFKEIQRINIDRLKTEGEYILSEANYFRLYTYAKSDLPSSVYAKSLLLLLKGERFEFPIGNFDVAKGRQAQARNRNNPNEISNIYLAPNPNDGYFRLSLNKQRIDNGVFSIIDLFGRVVYTQKIHSLGYEDFSIDVSNLSSGLYHAKLVDGDTFSWESKILIKTY